MPRLPKLVVLAVLLAGCSSGPRPAASPVNTCAAPPVVRRPVVEEGCREAAPLPRPADLRRKVFHHLRHHQRFPADRAALLRGFRQTTELTEEEAAWIAAQLPARTFATPAALFQLLFPTADPAVLARLQDHRAVGDRP